MAVALRLRHRRSHDLDLFSPSWDPSLLAREPLDPTVRILTRQEGTLYLEVAGVPTSILRYRYPPLGSTESVPDVAVHVAGLDDLECMKLSAIADRGAARDFWDLHAMLSLPGRSLAQALEA